MNLMEFVNIYIQQNHIIYHNSKKNLFSHYLKYRKKNINNSSPRYSIDTEAQEMNAMVDDIDRVLIQIAQQLKQVDLYIKEVKI